MTVSARPSETGPAGSEARADARLAGRLSLALGALVAAVVGLITLGALVRAHGAGLACPDWPLCFGELVPAFDLRVAFEWSHRVAAATISLVFAALAVLALRRPRTRAVAGRSLAVAAVLLAIQIALGGLTVLELLAAWTVTAHLVTGNLFALTLLLSSRQLAELAGPVPERAPVGGALRAGVAACGCLLAAQIVLGGLVSSTYAGLACPEWPTCSGGAWLPSLRGSVGLHIAHRTNGYLMVLALLASTWRARHLPRLLAPLRLALALGTLQALVGIANVLLALRVEVTGLHTALAAALVLALTLAAREVRAAPAARG